MVLVSVLAAVALLALLIAAIAVGMSWREARRRPHLTRAVEESEAKYQALVERLPAMVYLAELGKEGRWTYVSPELEVVLGYSPEEWVADRHLWIERIHEADRDRALQAERGLTGAGEHYRCEYRMIARDGRVLWIRDEAVVIKEEGKPVLQGFMYDISDQKRVDELIQEHQDTLEVTVRERTRDLEESRLEILKRLALPAEYRDDSTHEHTERVGRTAALIALKMGLPVDFAHVIRRAAPLHDVGKIGVPDSVLLKPGRLTAEEFELMKEHAKIGRRILAGSGFDVLQMAEEIAFTHHERWDGSGYPVGLVGGEIPISGRITTLADVFDALTHDRPYKDAWSIEHSVAEIMRLSGAQFDPQIVEAFIGLDHESLIGPVRLLGPGALEDLSPATSSPALGAP